MSLFLSICTIAGALLFTVGESIGPQKGDLLRILGFGLVSCVIIFLISFAFGGIN